MIFYVWCNLIYLTVDTLFLEHKLSDYSFEWHCKIGKTNVQTNKLWKAARAVINQDKVGSECIKDILSRDGKAINNTADGDGTKYTC